MYAVDGAMLPFFSVFLAFVHGLGTAQIGVVLAVSSAAAVIAPPVLTVAADRYGRAETLFLFVLAVSAIALSVFAFVGGYWWVVFVYAAFSLAREPTRPLLDGIFFSSQRHIRALAKVSYHQVRIWGTVGYMVPGVLLFFVLTDRHSLWLLPLVAVTAYSTFYPLMATEVVGLSPRWLGLVTNLGVLVEIAYMAAFGWLVRRLGWRWLMVLGAATATIRVALLAAFPTIGVVVGTQVVHGMVIIVSMVAGRVILDRRAPDAIRHTTQGLYAMLVLGGGRIVGSAFGGLVASHDLSRVFWAAALAALVAMLGLAWSLRGERPVAADGSPL
ncbi:hypothetical protein GCM10009872_41630 [Actinopolymorpha rutila]